MNKRKLLAKVRNNPRDVRFSDLILIVEAFGFRLRGHEGSHAVYAHGQCSDRLNLQPDKNGKAKPYQVRQFLRAVDWCGPTMEDTDD